MKDISWSEEEVCGICASGYMYRYSQENEEFWEIMMNMLKGENGLKKLTEYLWW